MLKAHLVKFHKDKDDDSLWVRFCEILSEIETRQFDIEATFSHLLSVIKENTTLKKKYEHIEKPMD